MTVRHLAVPAYTVPVAGGAVAFRSTSTPTTYASRSTTTITAPTSIVNDDLLIFVLAQGHTSSPVAATPPAGLTQIGTPTVINDPGGGFYVRLAVWYKKAASEAGNYAFTHATHSTQGAALCYSGVHLTTPLDVTATTNTGSGTTSTATGVTTVTNGAMIVVVEEDFADLAPASTPPTGMTERVDVTLLYAADEVRATAGATGNRTLTNSNNSGSAPWAAYLIALRPA